VAGPPAIVVVRMYEYGKKLVTITTNGESKSEKTEFEVRSFKTLDVEINENYYRVIKKMYDDGYVLSNSTAQARSPTSSTCILLFVKK